ncbi:MAG: alpha/beta hydrolase family protein [Pyrinomonadaceae bacterium]
MSVERREFLKSSAAALWMVTNFAMSASDTAAAQTKREFAAFQRRRRRELWGLLGDLPLKHAPGAPQLIKTERGDGYTLEHLVLDLNGIEPVPARLLIPDRRQPRAPGLLYIHAHGGTYELGGEELTTGRTVLPAYAPICAEQGIVALAIDSWCFGARRQKKSGAQGETDAFKLMLWRGQLLWGMMMFDEFQAVSYLCSRPEIDRARIGAFGLSMGATKAWWLAALDPRVRLCVDLCCLTDYEELIKIDNLQGHGVYYYVPRLLRHFQAHEINELIVPRPHLSLNGRHDLLTPPIGVERIRDHLLPLYRRYGREDDCLIELFESGHEETPQMRRLVLAWLDKHLSGSEKISRPN